MSPLLWLALAGCAPEGDSADGPRTVEVQRIDVQLSVDPEPENVIFENPDWIQLAHCGSWNLLEDTLVVYGELDPAITAVGLVRYPGWGGLFSGGGSSELELDLTEPVALHAALAPQRVLYTLSVDEPDTGVPGGERTLSYGPNEFPAGTTAIEVHQRHPLITAEVELVEPLPCAR